MSDKKVSLQVQPLGRAHKKDGVLDSSPEAAVLSEQVNSLILTATASYVLLHRPEVVIDEGLLSSVDGLVHDLDTEYPNWGMCAATGVRWDNARTYWYIRRAPENPETGVCPKPVAMVGSEVLLLNVQSLRDSGCAITHHTNQWFEIGPLLALACLRRERCVLADRRLMAVDAGEAPNLELATALQQSSGESFLNHRLSTPYGAVAVPGVSYREYLALPPIEHGKKDLLSCYDRALRGAREASPTRLTIVCRTQFNRPHLLSRALLSFVAAQVECPAWLSLRTVIISDQKEELVNDEVTRLQQKYTALKLSGLHVSSRSRTTSRVDHLLTAIREIDTDYIWFIDDDDFVMPGAVPALARTLVPDAPMVVVGTSEVLDEEWVEGQLRRFQTLASFVSSKVFEVFKGENHVPICSMVVSSSLAKERCKNVSATGEYLEDYFILMRILTAPRLEIEVLPTTLAGISLRGTENTVRESVREKWNKSYSQFIGEILRSDDSANPLLWQLARGK